MQGGNSTEILPVGPIQFRVPDPDLGWVLKAGMRMLNPLPEGSVLVEYNSDGWRDTEHDPLNLENKTRIVVLGDSFMEAYSVDVEQAFHKQLERLATAQGINLEAINLGIGGYGTLQEYLAYKKAGKSFSPKVVLLGFYLSNDVHNNSLHLSTDSEWTMKSKSRPFLDPSKDKKWKIIKPDFQAAMLRYTETTESLFWQMKQYSALAAMMSQARKKLKALPFVPNAYNYQQKRVREFAIHCDDSSVHAQAWKITERILRKLKADVEESGGTLVVFSVPGLHEVETNSDARFLADLEPHYKNCIANLTGYTKLATMLQENKIQFVDLLRHFKKRTNEAGKSLFRWSDKHWNNKGHELAAEVVFSRLVSENLIRP